VSGAAKPPISIDSLRVDAGHAAKLDKRDPSDRLGLVDKESTRLLLPPVFEELDSLLDRLWAESTRSVLLVLQGMDTSGKDGVIRRVVSSVNPQGVRIANFKAPSSRELAQDYLWRVHVSCPPRGHLGVFNRSHYEDVVAAKLFGVVDQQQCDLRYRHIVEFERMLADEGTTIVKAFLNISRDEQRERLQARLDDPTKHWKFNRDDLKVRAQWDDYQVAYERAVTETSTEWAPWYVVPANRKWVRDVAIASLLLDALRGLDPQFPPPEPGLDKIVIPE
jgi:PPK2 family polyphosphate:nucleotide phosphotransferase